MINWISKYVYVLYYIVTGGVVADRLLLLLLLLRISSERTTCFAYSCGTLYGFSYYTYTPYDIVVKSTYYKTKTSENITHQNLSKFIWSVMQKCEYPILKSYNMIPNSQFGFKSKHSSLNQVHRVIDIIYKHSKKNFTLQVSSLTFDRV